MSFFSESPLLYGKTVFLGLKSQKLKKLGLCVSPQNLSNAGSFDKAPTTLFLKSVFNVCMGTFLENRTDGQPVNVKVFFFKKCIGKFRMNLDRAGSRIFARGTSIISEIYEVKNILL